jgi:hypothetical protein
MSAVAAALFFLEFPLTLTDAPHAGYRARVEVFIGAILLTAPLAYWAWTFARLLAGRRWRYAGGWALSTLTISLLVAGNAVRQAVALHPLGPGERFDWEGWYWIGPVGAYWTGWLAIAASGVALILSWGRRRWRRRLGATP